VSVCQCLAAELSQKNLQLDFNKVWVSRGSLPLFRSQAEPEVFLMSELFRNVWVDWTDFWNESIG